MLSTLSLACFAILAAVIPGTKTNSLHGRQDREPCAELSSSTIYNEYVSAELALACLRSVPLQPAESLRMQLLGLRTFVEFQSDLAYLNSSDFSARLYPSVDILGGLDALEDRLNDSFYANEYDFQLDISRLFASAYDGHLAYLADIITVFGFQRGAPTPYRLISVSLDGREVPNIYAAIDGPGLVRNSGYEPASISQINGQDAVEFLEREAAMTGGNQDPDTNFNRLFRRTYAQGTASGAFAIPEFPFFGAANGTVVTFSNGSTQNVETVAFSNIQLDGVTNGADFFQRCCSGNPQLRGFEFLLDQLEQAAEAGTLPSMESRDRIKAAVGPNIASATAGESQRMMPSMGGHHITRQADVTEGDRFASGFTSTEDGSLIGYFPDSEPDLAILALTTFAVGVEAGTLDEAGIQVVQDYQSALLSFIDAAGEANRTRLIIDLRGNPGGLGYLPHQVFRFLFPTSELPYQGSNLRAHDLLNFAGQVVTDLFSNPLAARRTDLRSTLGVFGLDSSQQLDDSNSTFESWSDFFGPVQVPSVDGDFTEITVSNYNDPNQTQPIDLTRPLGSRQQVFDAENIVLLQDGICASACALFVEFMKTSAPDGPVRQVVLGGRPQIGPSQGVGSVKGGQLAPMFQFGIVLLTGITLNEQVFFEFQDEFGREAIPAFVEALNRSTTGYAAVNYRNSIREDDDSVTPLQYVYEAAECRLFYTAETLGSQDDLWRRVGEVAFGGADDACVEGSTGHPSAAGGTDFGGNEVPENAASSFGVSMSESRARSGGRSGSGRLTGGEEAGNEEGDESGAVRAYAPAASLLVAFVMYLLL